LQEQHCFPPPSPCKLKDWVWCDDGKEMSKSEALSNSTPGTCYEFTVQEDSFYCVKNHSYFRDFRECVNFCGWVGGNIGQSVPESVEPSQCCEVKHDLKAFPGDPLPGPRKGDIVGKSGEYCELGSIQYPSRHWGAYCTIDSIYTISDWIFWLVLIGTTIVIVAAGLIFFTAGADPNKVSTAKRMVLYGVVGLLVAILAKFIPSVARYFIGV